MPGDIEYRKVQLTGGSTFTVSLPKEWARSHGVGNGARVSVEARGDGTLVIWPTHVEDADVAPAEVDATRLPGAALLRVLIGRYLAGYDSILVRASPRLTLEQRETVRRFTRSCLGPEIVEETGERVLVRDLVSASEFTLPSALNRIHLITKSMILDALTALEHHDNDVAADVRTRDDEVDRLYRLVAKRFIRMLQGGPGTRDPSVTLQEAQRIHQVSRLLERCADHASNVAKLASELKTKPLKSEDLQRLLQLGIRANDLLDRAFRSLLRDDWSEANRVVDDSAKLLSDKSRLREAFYGYGSQNAATLTLLLESLERIHQYASDIAEVALDAPLRRPPETPETPGQRVMRRTSVRPTKRVPRGGD